MKAEILECCEITIKHEDAFIDLCFEMGEIEGMKPEDVKQYIRYIGDRRLQTTRAGSHLSYREKSAPMDG